jgi:excinuclease ABC subunit C
MLDAAGRLLYVGKAKVLRSRLLSYCRTKSRDRKAARVIRLTRTILWEPCLHELDALVRELELIRRWRPPCNVQGQPTRRRPTYLCLGRRPAPHIFLARHPTPDVMACFGPLFSGRRLTEVVRHLNDLFQLRDCPQRQEMIFADQREMFPILRSPGCLRYEIGTCLGPCIGACTREAYGAQVRAVFAFLAGKKPTLVDKVQKAMAQASESQLFEKAALLRDRVELMQWLERRLAYVRTVRERQSFIYTPKNARNQTVWFVIHEGQVVTIFEEPHSRLEIQKALTCLEKVYRHEGRTRADIAAREIDHIYLVSSWFRLRPAEKDEVRSPAEMLDQLRQRVG